MIEDTGAEAATMKSGSFLTRMLALFLSVGLGLPPPALGLRTLQPTLNSGLEEEIAGALRRSATGLEEEIERLLDRLAQRYHEEEQLLQGTERIRALLRGADLEPKLKPLIDHWPAVIQAKLALSGDLLEERVPDLVLPHLEELEAAVGTVLPLIQQGFFLPGTKIFVLASDEEAGVLLQQAVEQVRGHAEWTRDVVDRYLNVVAFGSLDPEAAAQIYYGGRPGDFRGWLHVKWPFYPELEPDERGDELEGTIVEEVSEFGMLEEWPTDRVIENSLFEFDGSLPALTFDQSPYSYLVEAYGNLNTIRYWHELALVLSDQPDRQARLQRWVQREMGLVQELLGPLSALLDQGVLTSDGQALVRRLGDQFSELGGASLEELREAASRSARLEETVASDAVGQNVVRKEVTMTKHLHLLGATEFIGGMEMLREKRSGAFSLTFDGTRGKAELAELNTAVDFLGLGIVTLGDRFSVTARSSKFSSEVLEEAVAITLYWLDQTSQDDPADEDPPLGTPVEQQQAYAVLTQKLNALHAHIVASLPASARLHSAGLEELRVFMLENQGIPAIDSARGAPPLTRRSFQKGEIAERLFLVGFQDVPDGPVAYRLLRAAEELKVLEKRRFDMGGAFPEDAAPAWLEVDERAWEIADRTDDALHLQGLNVRVDAVGGAVEFEWEGKPAGARYRVWPYRLTRAHQAKDPERKRQVMEHLERKDPFAVYQALDSVRKMVELSPPGYPLFTGREREALTGRLEALLGHPHLLVRDKALRTWLRVFRADLTAPHVVQLLESTLRDLGSDLAVARYTAYLRLGLLLETTEAAAFFNAVPPATWGRIVQTLTERGLNELSQEGIWYPSPDAERPSYLSLETHPAGGATLEVRVGVDSLAGNPPGPVQVRLAAELASELLVKLSARLPQFFPGAGPSMRPAAGLEEPAGRLAAGKPRGSEMQKMAFSAHNLLNAIELISRYSGLLAAALSEDSVSRPVLAAMHEEGSQASRRLRPRYEQHLHGFSLDPLKPHTDEARQHGREILGELDGVLADLVGMAGKVDGEESARVPKEKTDGFPGWEVITLAVGAATQWRDQAHAILDQAAPAVSIVDLSEIFRDLGARLTRSMAAYGIALRIEEQQGESPLRVRVNPEEFGAVMSNLVHNAQEAIQGEQGRTEAGEIVLTLSSEVSHAVMEVADNGPGIKPDTIWSGASSKPEPGHGGGLLGTRQRVQGWGAAIEAAPRVGRPGSVFTIRIPLAAAAGLEEGGVLFSGLTAVGADGQIVLAPDVLPAELVLTGLEAGRSRLVVAAAQPQVTGRIFLGPGVALSPQVRQAIGVERIFVLPAEPMQARAGLEARKAGAADLVLLDAPHGTERQWAPPSVPVINLPGSLAPQLTQAQWAGLEEAARKHGGVLRINAVIQRNWTEPLDVFDVAT